MFVCEIVFFNHSELLHGCKVKSLAISTFEYGCPFFCIEEFAFFIEKFEGVPLARVVGGGNDYASVSTGESHCHFGGRCGSKSSLHHIHSAGYEGAAYNVFHHLSAKAGILADHHLVAFSLCLGTSFAKFGAISVCEFYDVNGCQSISRGSSYGSAYSGNGFYQCHKFVFLFVPAFRC